MALVNGNATDYVLLRFEVDLEARIWIMNIP